MGRITLAAAVAAIFGCTSVHMVQRDGCWMKKTERTFGGESEELAFCSKPAPQWSEDRLERLVQECMAQADYRWQNRALAAWSRSEPIPPADSDEQISRTCMSQAAAALGLEAENGALKARLGELGSDRDALRSAAQKDREFLEQTSDKMVSALGEAAKKPVPNATATATAKMESDTRSSPAPVVPPTTTVVGIGAPTPIVLAPAPAKANARAPAAACKPAARKLTADKAAVNPNCDEPATTKAEVDPHAG